MVIREKGIITHLMPEVSGTSKAGNAYTLREFVIEVNDEGYKNPLHFIRQPAAAPEKEKDLPDFLQDDLEF